jgi:hypothetical protein
MYSKLAIRLLFYLALWLFSACEKIDDCFQKTGNITQKELSITNHSPVIWGVEVFDNIDLVLIPTTDSVAALRIEAGSNIIDKITFRYNAATQKWELRNENTCNWVRSYKIPVKAYLSCSTLQGIRVSGYGNVSIQGIWKHNDYLEIRAFGTGTIQAAIEAPVFYIDYNSRGGLMQLKGKAEKMVITTLNSNTIQAFELQTKETTIFHRGFGEIQVQVNEKLDGTIEEAGNIYVKGNPEINIVTKRDGQVIFVP